MKKKIIKMMRSLIYLILKFIRFPRCKKSRCKEFNELNNRYKDKVLEPIYNSFSVDEKNDLTIIIPVYNAEKFIKKCLDSVINQKTKYAFDIVCINDGSTDNSLSILKEYEKKYNIITVISQDNKGISETRNLGIQYITGKYVAFIDIDDYISEDYIEKLLDCAYQNNSDIVRCNYYVFDVNKNTIVKTGKEQENKNFCNGIGNQILNYKGYPWGGIFKSELWRNVQYPNGFWYEDMIIRMIIFRKAKVFSYINDKLYYYCLHNNNISNSIEKTTDTRCLDHYYLVKRLKELSDKLELVSDEALATNILYEYGVVLWLRTRKLEKRLRKDIFYDACHIVSDIEVNSVMKNDNKIILDIFNRRDYMKWKLYAIYKMIGVKYGVE